jgi:hypothetical protein
MDWMADRLPFALGTLAWFVLVASPGCKGEQAFSARDATAVTGGGGGGVTGGGGGGANGGAGGASGTGPCATDVTTCVAPNLAGNGDLETGTTTTWLAANGGGTLGLSVVAASGVAHAGGYSVFVSGRQQFYQGPGYDLPTGAGKYAISVWALQKDLPSINGLVQLRVICQTNTSYYVPVQPSGFGVAMPQGVWTSFSATIDTGAAGPDCMPNGATPGLVKAANLYLNHTAQDGGPLPDLYLDDLIVEVTDGHNLVGNPNFEAGSPDGWSVSAGSATLSVSNTVAHAGTQSLHLAVRTMPATGPKYMLPTGAAKYAISFWVQHTGATAHDLILQPTYTCIGGSQVTAAPIATATAVAGNAWTQLGGTVTLPPADAPAGCTLALASVHVQHEGTACGSASGQVECPELYIDDVSITLAP